MAGKTDPENSGPVEADQDVIASPSDAQDVTASPSDAPEQDVKEPESMYDAVLAEVGKSSEPDSEDGTEPEAKADVGTKTAEDAEAKTEEDAEAFLENDPDENEVKDYSKKAQARIRSLIDQRNEAAEVANRAAPIVDFMRENDIPMQDVDVILGLTARLRHGDFAGFLAGVEPYVNLARQYTGQTLPQDLQKQVREGTISPPAAKELAQRRAEAAMHKQQMDTVQRTSHERQAKDRATSIRSAVIGYESQLKARDPDYALKADVIRRTAQALMQEHGAPQTPDQAVEYVKMAYNEANEQVKRFRPAPKPTAKTPGSTGQGGAAPVAEPKSMFEAAMQAIEKPRV